MNQTERELLKRARKKIEKRTETFLCHAIEYSATTMEERVAAGQLKNYIRQVLGGEPTLEGWQERNGWGHYKRGFDQVRQDRLNWIDWMLGDLE